MELATGFKNSQGSKQESFVGKVWVGVKNVRVALLEPSVEILRVVSNTWGNSLGVNAHALTQQPKKKRPSPDDQQPKMRFVD